MEYTFQIADILYSFQSFAKKFPHVYTIINGIITKFIPLIIRATTILGASSSINC